MLGFTRKNKLGCYWDNHYLCSIITEKMNFKSLTHLLDHFKDEQKAIKYFEYMRWQGNPICPHCNAEKPYVTTRGYKCSNNECHKKFTVKVGTVFESSKIPFRIWFAVIFMCGTDKQGVNSMMLSRQLGIPQKTAWFVLHRVREMLKAQMPDWIGEGEETIVEVDETHIGGKEKNRHKGKRRSNDDPDKSNNGSPYNHKKIAVGLVERNGKVILKHIQNTKKNTLLPVINKHVKHGANLNTDELSSYRTLGEKYNHSTVVHSKKQYVCGDCHTNNIENVWSIFSRGINGSYIHVSEKHLQRYLNETAARYNNRKCNPSDVFNNFLLHTEGFLPYKILTAKD